jgi:hypothetical protein
LLSSHPSAKTQLGSWLRGLEQRELEREFEQARTRPEIGKADLGQHLSKSQ